jgi:uncharacterized protein YndB with AHSA1/START domain
MRNSITIERTIASPVTRVFDALITPSDLTQWHHAGHGWSTPYAEVDPKVGGRIKIAYADEKGNVAFDLTAVIDEIVRPTRYAYRLCLGEIVKDDDRLVAIDLHEVEGATHVTLELDLENVNSADLQRQGWTEHLDNLEAYLGNE